MEKLYNFTSRVHYYFIQTHGLDRGECPVSKTKILQHPNLTSDPKPHLQGWSDESGGKVKLTTNKAGVRITVEIPDSDPSLITWRKLTEEHGMDRATYKQYDASGGLGTGDCFDFQDWILRQ